MPPDDGGFATETAVEELREHVETLEGKIDTLIGHVEALVAMLAGQPDGSRGRDYPDGL